MTNAIEVHSLCKSYRLGKAFKGGAEIHNALDSVSFDVPVGQRLGIIGKNGAGKSTLLKILSRITAPTSGEVKIRGTIGSLLEVGTGFHPELTGRENVFLNGSILGMSSQQIAKRFDEIVDFSGVAKFIDTPLKRYSSGMQTRLAFAVAAFLEPEIMIVDEVLAVGDAEFQEKCMKQMDGMASSGKTILFVSHNMASIRRVCDRCLLLQQGRIVEDSENIDFVVGKYLRSDKPPTSSWHNSDGISFSGFKPLSAELTSCGETLDRPCYPDEDVHFQFQFEIDRDISNLSIGLHLYNANMEEIFYSYNTDNYSYSSRLLNKGRHTIAVKIPVDILNAQEFILKVAVGIIGEKSLFSASESQISLKFKVHENKLRSGYWYNHNNPISPLLHWGLI